MKIARILLYCTILASTIVGPSAFGQADTAPVAPIPTQILNGKTVFISNAGVGLSTLSTYIEDRTGSTNGLYNDFYAGMKSWGKYQLVDSPSDADLVFEIQMLWEHPGPGVNPDVQIRILDPKTHIVLWQIMEYMNAGSAREGTRRKQWQAVMAKVMNDVKQLATQPSTSSGSQ